MAPPVERPPEIALPKNLNLDLGPSVTLEAAIRNFGEVCRVLTPVLAGKKTEGSAEYEFVRSRMGNGEFEKGKQLLTEYLSRAIDFMYRKAQEEGSTSALEGNRDLRDILINLRRRSPGFEFLRELEPKLVQLTSGEALPERVVGTAKASTTLFSDLPRHVEIRETLGASTGARYAIAQGMVTAEIRGLAGGDERLASSLVNNTALLLTAELNKETDMSIGTRELAASFRTLKEKLGGASDYDEIIKLLEANDRKGAIDLIKKDTTLESLLKATNKTLAVKFTDQAAVVFTLDAEIVYDISRMDTRTRAKWLGDVRARTSIIYAYLVGGGFLREGELTPQNTVQGEKESPLSGSGHAFITRPGLEFSWRPVRLLISMDVGYRQMTLEKPAGVEIPKSLEESFKQEGWYVNIPRIELQRMNAVGERARFVFTRAGVGGLGDIVGIVQSGGPAGVHGWIGGGIQWGYHLIKNSKGAEVGSYTNNMELVVGAGILVSKGLATIDQIAKGEIDPNQFGKNVTKIVNAELNNYFRISTNAAGNFLVGPAIKYQALINDRGDTHAFEGVVQFNYSPPLRKGYVRDLTITGTAGGRGEFGAEALLASARVGVGITIHLGAPDMLGATDKLIPTRMDQSTIVRNRAQDLSQKLNEIQGELSGVMPAVDALSDNLLRALNSERYTTIPQIKDNPNYMRALELLKQVSSTKDASEIPKVEEGAEPPPTEVTKQSLLNEALQLLNRVVVNLRRNPLGN